MRHNHLAIALAVIVNNVIGFLLHAPFTFLEPWARGLGVEVASVAEPSGGTLGLGVLGSFAIMYCLSWLFHRVGVTSAWGGASFAVAMWLGLALPFTLVQYSFAGFGAGAVLVDGFNQLGTLAVGGGIIGGWPSRARKLRMGDSLGPVVRGSAA